MKTKHVLFLFCLFQLYLTSATNKYTLKIKNGIDGSDNIVLVPGIFTKITLELSSEDGEDFVYEEDEKKKISYKVTFNNDNIVVYHKELILTPQDSLVYTNYIGISCQDVDEDSFSLSINADKNNDYTDDNSIVYDKEVKVKISKLKTKIKLDLLLESMAQLSKNYFTLENELYNIDEIKISLDDKLKAMTKFKFNEILITSFKDRLEEEISKESSANHGILFDSPFFPEDKLESAKFKFNLNLDAKTTGLCFELSKSEFEFELKTDGVIDLDSKIKSAIIYNTENETPKYDVSNIIKINTKIPIYPVILECHFSVDSDFSINDKNYLKSTVKENVFKTIVTSRGNFDIIMKNLNISAEYYAKCDISTTAIDEYIKKIEITIGNFNTSDIIRQLIPSKDPNATPQCARFTFGNELQSAAFSGLAPFYCKYYMKKKDPLIARAIPSIICQSTKFEGIYSTLCASPSPLYNTAKFISKKETDFNKRFDEFIEDIKKLDLSKYSLGLIKLEVKNVEREYDISINPSSISVSYLKTNKLDLLPHEFLVKSTHSQQLECYYNLFLTNENSKFLKLIENSIVLSPNKETKVKVGSVFIREGMYSLNFKCYNLPGYIYKTESTGIMTKYSYYYPGGLLPDIISDLIGDLINGTTINCNEKKNSINPRCLKNNINSIIDQIKTDIPKAISKIQEEVEHFAALAKKTKEEILDKLITEFEKVKESLSIKEIIEKVIEILKYLTYTDCSIYASGSTNKESETIKGELYLECRKKKQDILEKLLNTLKNHLQCESVINLIISKEVSDDLEENIKYILFLINELSNNPESFKDKTSEIIISLAECIDEKFDEYWPKVQDYLNNTKKYWEESIIAIKRDSINIILQTLENLAKVIDFDQLDGYISDAEKKITKTGLILYDKAKSIQKKILEFARRLNEFGTANYTFSGSMLANIELKKELSILADAEIKATFVPDKDIVILTHSNLLFNNDNAYALQTLVFESPIVSVKTTAEVEGSTDALSTFISITLYDKNGKEITIDKIKEALRPQILYLKEKYEHLNACFYYDENKNDLLNKGISTIEKVTFMGKEYFKCVSSHLTSFTAGTTSKDISESESNKKSNTTKLVLIILSIIVILAIIAIIAFIFIKKRSNNKLGDAVDNEFDKNEEGLVAS